MLDPSTPTVSTIVLSLVAIVFSSFILPMFWSKPKWNPRDKQCVVTGGSSGLGLAFATLLVQKGAHVAIIARDEAKLKAAHAKLEAARVTSTQIITYHSYSLSTVKGATEALEAAAKPHSGHAPDALFTCAGFATPGYFLEQSEDDLLKGMMDAYWIQAYPALAATKMMTKQGVRGRICLVGSILGYIGLIGYSNYAPAKHALTGLADSLRFELALYGIDVQLFQACTMYTPGYENENKTKPAITLKIEETDPGLSPEQAAAGMMKGVQNNHAHFAADFTTNLIRVGTRGSAPNHNIIWDTILAMISWPGIPIWRWAVEKEIRKGREAHLDVMRAKGFVP